MRAYDIIIYTFKNKHCFGGVNVKNVKLLHIFNPNNDNPWQNGQSDVQ